MKRMLFILICTIPLIGFAQDYQTVRSDFVHFFLDENGNDYGMRMDSIGVEGADSVLINYLTLRYPDYDLIDAYVPSWLGEKTVVRPNGDNLFFNSTGDSILIETQALLNDTWNLFNLDPASFLEATVTAIGTETILETSVSVKTITLQRKDYSNNSLSHPLNGKTIKLSDNLGIIQGFDFHVFPEDTTQIEIAGMENPNVGVHRLTWDEVYDFQVGDEFHYGYWENLWGNVGSPLWEKRIQRVVAVNNDTNQRQVTFEIWKWVQWFDGQPGPFTGVTESANYEDIRSYPFLNSQVYEAMPNEAALAFDTTTLPEFGTLDDFSYGYFQTTSIPVITILDDYFAWYALDTLDSWEFEPSVSGWDFESEIYGHGIGRTYFSRQIGNNSWNHLDHVERLVYFKKSNTEWGIPYTISEVMGIEDSPKGTNLPIYPNPIKQGDLLGLGANYNAIEVLDLTGKVALVKSNASTLETQSLSPGVYLIKTTAETNSAVQRLVVTK